MEVEQSSFLCVVPLIALLMVRLKNKQVSELTVVFNNIAKPCSFTAKHVHLLFLITLPDSDIVGLHQHIMTLVLVSEQYLQLARDFCS